MKALISADWHLADNARDEYRWRFVEQELPEILQDEGVSLLLFLGDATEAKSGHSAELVNRLVAAFKRLALLCPVVGLTGNHDGLSPSKPFWAFLAELERVSWVQTPTVLADLKNVPESFPTGASTILLPNTQNHERDWEDIDFRRFKWAFAHQSFAGASSESGFKLSGIPLSYFPKDLEIVAGDIHQPQTLGQLTYVGSPYTVDFGDAFKPRVLLWNGKRLESLQIFGPQKQLVEASSIKALSKQKLEKGDIVKVRLEIDSYDDWPEAKKEIEAWALDQGVTLHLAQPIIASATAQRSTPEFETLSEEEILKAYAKKHDLNAAYVSVGLRLL